MRRRLILLGALLASVGCGIYLAWPRDDAERAESKGRNPVERSASTEPRMIARDAVMEVTTVPGDNLVQSRDALVGFPADAESWRRAVESYSQADDDAYLDRRHNSFAAAKHSQAIEAAPVNSDERRRLRDLLMSKELAEIDLGIAAKKSGVSRRGPEFEALVAAERAKIDQQIVALVGPAYFAEMEKMPGFRGIRLLGFHLMGETYLRGVPLSDNQVEGINQVIATIGDEPRNLPVDPAAGLHAFDTKFLESAKATLTAEQWEIFRQLRVDENLYEAAMALKKQRQAQEKARASEVKK